MKATGSPQVVRFGVFEVDLRAEELRKNGSKIRLRGQPFQVLAMLLERPGEIVTREELQQKLWPEGTFVDFDHSLNTAINKIREVLGDSAENPRFVETLPRRGYRFVAAVESAAQDINTEIVSSGSEVLTELKPAGGDEEPPAEKDTPVIRTRWSARWVWPAAICVLVIGAVAWFYLSRLGSETLPPMKVIRLTSFPGQETEPALSPDGKMVAFVWNGEKEDNWDIYVMLVDAGTPLRLTSDPGDDFSPAWSPDGRFIAFCWASKEHTDIYTVPSLGGPERRLEAENPSIGGGPWSLDWSPDGKVLAVSEPSLPGMPSSIFLLTIENGKKRQLTFPSAALGDVHPAFSPDGRTLAFTRSIGITKLDIFGVPILGGEPRRLTLNESSVTSAWTPDGQGIVFASWMDGIMFVPKLYKVPAQGGTPVPLTTGGQFGSSPSISHHGDRLVYSEGIYDTDIWQIDLPGRREDPRPPKRLITSSQRDDAPHFSPDGEKIAFNSNRSGSYEIWICDSGGRTPSQLTFFGKPIQTGTPRWSPDGKLIAFDSRPKGLSDIFVINADGGSPRCLTEESFDDLVPSWSRDGRWIYFGSDRGGKGDWQVWKIPVEGGKAVQVTKKGGLEGAESFDGKFVYYSKEGYDEIWRVPASGGEETLFLHDIEWRYWAVAEKGIYFIAREDRNPFIYFMNFATRHVSRVIGLEKKLATDAARGLALSPDGHSLLCTLVEQDSSDIMLIENFR
jgi:Tol biopolymer transport system component/DNA-binding winged helix-turn-helix (wHTH) protein